MRQKVRAHVPWINARQSAYCLPELRFELFLFLSELRKLASVLVDGWMTIIRAQSVSSGVSPNGRVSSLHCLLSLCFLLKLKYWLVLKFFVKVLLTWIIRKWGSHYWQITQLCFPSDKKRKKEDGKVRPEVKLREKGADEEKKDKPKAYAPSHAKIRSTG